MKIEIERFEQPKVDVYYKNEYYGTFNNEHECNLFRIKLVENNCTDLYHLEWNGEKITFSQDGDMNKFPTGMYDTLTKHFGILFRMRKEKLNNGKVTNER